MGLFTRTRTIRTPVSTITWIWWKAQIWKISSDFLCPYSSDSQKTETILCVVVNMLLEVVAMFYILKLKLCHLTNTDISDQSVERNKEERKLWEGITWHDVVVSFSCVTIFEYIIALEATLVLFTQYILYILSPRLLLPLHPIGESLEEEVFFNFFLPFFLLQRLQTNYFLLYFSAPSERKCQQKKLFLLNNYETQYFFKNLEAIL